MSIAYNTLQNIRITANQRMAWSVISWTPTRTAVTHFSCALADRANHTWSIQCAKKKVGAVFSHSYFHTDILLSVKNLLKHLWIERWVWICTKMNNLFFKWMEKHNKIEANVTKSNETNTGK